METLTANIAAAKIKRRTEGGKSYLVAPLSLLVPGVLNGSKGSLYYPPEEVARNHQQWNNIPLVVYHPTDNGRNVSAKHPGILEKSGVGFIRNARINPKGKLVAEGWFDEQAVKRVDSRVYSSLSQGIPIELSTGLFTDNEAAPFGSQHNGKYYDFVAKNYTADHLAILPDQVGACSLNDGCGVGVIANSNPEGHNQYTHFLSAKPHGLNDWKKIGKQIPEHVAKSMADHFLSKKSQGFREHVEWEHKSGLTQIPGSNPLSKRPELMRLKTALEQHASEHANKLGQEARSVAGGDKEFNHMENRISASGGHHVSSDMEYEGWKDALKHLQTNSNTIGVVANKKRTGTVKNPTSNAKSLWRKLGEVLGLTNNRDWPQSKRDKTPDSDFAGPNQSFPITSQADVEAAAHLVGKAANPEAVKARIKAIAKRKGLKLPAAWENEPTENLDPRETLKAAKRLSAHAHEISKLSPSYDGSIQEHSEAAVAAARAKNGEKASDSHIKAALAHIDKLDFGDESEAEIHKAAAEAHLHASKAYKGVVSLTKTEPPLDDANPYGSADEDEEKGVTNSEGEIVLTANQRSMIINSLVEDCNCPDQVFNELDRPVLEKIDDSTLVQLLADNAKKKPPKSEKEDEDGDDKEPDADIDDNCKGTMTKNQKGTTMAVTKEEALAALKGLTEEEFLSIAPAPLREAVTNGRNIVNKTKADLITKLTANVKDEGLKTRQITRLQEMSVNELEDLVAMIPTPTENTQVHPVSYYMGMNGGIPQGTPTRNKEEDKALIEAMRPKKIDFAELSKSFRQN